MPTLTPSHSKHWFSLISYLFYDLCSTISRMCLCIQLCLLLRIISLSFCMLYCHNRKSSDLIFCRSFPVFKTSLLALDKCRWSGVTLGQAIRQSNRDLACGQRCSGHSLRPIKQWGASWLARPGHSTLHLFKCAGRFFIFIVNQ